MKEIPQNMCAVLFKMTLILYLDNKSLSMAITLFFFYNNIFFMRISRLKFAKSKEYFKNKLQAEILKRIISCGENL